MENFNVEQNEFENKKKRLEVAFQKVEKITDKLGKGIDDGIKEAVAILMAMNLKTSSSCAGHKGEEGKFGLPYIEVYTPAPKGWKEDPKNIELCRLWRQSNLKQRAIIQPLFDEFDRTQNVPPDVRVHISDMGIFGGFRIENVGGITPNSKEGAIKVVEAYQQEMAEFTKFLKEKYLDDK